MIAMKLVRLQKKKFKNMRKRTTTNPTLTH
ncbi:UNVERIFIED_CONTAM: hypothetical protein GTU68_021996 [Idotea baltica]|nr:hypothetical protein [Idotea baltica]